MRLTSITLALAFLALVSGCNREESGSSGANPPTASASPSPCEKLAALALPNTKVAGATIVAAGTFAPPVPDFPGQGADYSKLPAFCRVTGSIQPSTDSDIRFEVWLPAENWNGKFMQTGNGGAAGAIVYNSLADALKRGYAVANTDTGHQAGGGDFSWALDHPEKLTDYAYRAVHELTVVGKAVTAARYGREPAKSYWNGCSTGGRQGLKEAQQFPDDYDAIIAGAPASNWSALMSFSVLVQRNMTGPEGLGADKLGLLKEAAIAACDAHDGVVDRVIGAPAECRFDPVVTQCTNGNTEQCLSSQEIAAAKRIYAGAVSKTGEILLPGTGPGSEPLWAAYASPGFAIGSNYFRNVIARDQSWDPASFDLDVDIARAETQDGGAAKAMDPDLSAFVAHGGKLITYHGTTDGLIPYGNSVRYYESVVAKGGDRIEKNVALYLVPGMDHCTGGEGAFEIDWVAALEGWEQTGQKPNALDARHPASVPGSPLGPPATSKPFTRRVCAYPQTAKYKGEGDNADAANWECVAP